MGVRIIVMMMMMMIMVCLYYGLAYENQCFHFTPRKLSRIFTISNPKTLSKELETGSLKRMQVVATTPLKYRAIRSNCSMNWDRLSKLNGKQGIGKPTILYAVHTVYLTL